MEWTAHEADFLAWLRLRAALGASLGWPGARRLQEEDLAMAKERPPSLDACTPTCVRRVAGLLATRGLAAAETRGWALPAPPPTGLQACWNLIPGFHGRWDALWSLRALEDAFGDRAFTPAMAEAALLQGLAAAAVSPLHRQSRRAPPPDAAQKAKTLLAEGWLLGPADRMRLTPRSLDALTLLRLVQGSRVQVRDGALDRIGRIRAPSRG